MGNLVDLSLLDNPEITEINALKNHSDHRTYINGRINSFSLNGEWKFRYFNNFSDDINFLLLSNVDISGFDVIKVPGHFELQGYGKPKYVNQQYEWSGVEQVELGKSPKNNPCGIYFKDFEMKNNLTERVILKIDGFNTALYLFVNGNFVGFSEKNYTTTEFDLSNHLIKGINRIAFIVFKYSKMSWFSDQDMWRFSGIFRDVSLEFVPFNHIFDIKNASTLLEDNSTGVLDITLTTTGDFNNVFIKSTFRFKDTVLFEEINPLTEREFFIKKSVSNVFPWTAETPSLYTLELELIRNNQNVEKTEIKIGFRHIEIKNNVITINGRKIFFKGVNRHEFDMEHGRAISDELIKNDLLLLKANNFNAIRTSHYPNKSYFYELADELGFYIIDEVDLETHGTWGNFLKKDSFSKVLPGDHLEFLDVIIKKDNAIYERDKNHPSVIIWSLGNESNVGKVLEESSKYFKEIDPLRLVHYEGSSSDKRYSCISDIDSTMYSSPNELKKRLSKQKNKPFILCEFEHSMGNSTGNFDEYMSLRNEFENYQGGFIWDFVDQGLVDLSTKTIKYGGDFDDKPNDGVFSCDGLLLADRSVTSKLTTVKYHYQDLFFERLENSIRIVNTNSFIDTSKYYFKLEIYANGVLKSSEPFSLTINPQGEFILRLDNLNIDHSKENLVRISYHLASDTEYANKDYEIGFFEFLFNSSYEFAPSDYQLDTGTKFNVIEDSYNIGIRGQNFAYLFNGLSEFRGGLYSIKINKDEFLKDSIKPNFYRPTTDNDNSLSRFKLDTYMHASKMLFIPKFGLKKPSKITEKSAKLTYIYRYFYGFLPKKVKISYNIREDGSILVSFKGKISAFQHAPGEIGINFIVPEIIDSFTYYGLGDGDNYIDRYQGQKLGIYESNPFREYVNYAKPQECGQHLFTRYLVLKKKSGAKLGIFALNKSFAFKVLPWSNLEIENATHLDELPKAKYTHVTISSNTRGVGGDNSWYAPVHKEYRLKRKTKFALEFIIKKVD